MRHPLIDKKRAYARLFPYERGRFIGDAHTVMADLAKFCGATKPAVARNPLTGAIDAHETLVRAARLEVFNRIRAMTLMDESTLFNLREETHSDD